MKHSVIFLFLAVFLCTAIVFSLLIGAVSISWSDLSAIVGAFIHQQPISDSLQLSQYVITELRLPRTFTALTVGLGLAVAGTCTQGLFRNPLADPSLIGVSSGSAFGAIFVIVIGPLLFQQFDQIGHLILPVFAFTGGLLATLIAFQIASSRGHTDTALLLLAGVAINAICFAGIGFLSYLADDNQLRDLTFWNLGSVAKTTWPQIAVAALFIIPASVGLFLFQRALNCLLMGEAVAGHIGYNVIFIKRMIIILTSLIVGCSVAISGVIGFLGLVVPHMMRILVGSDHRLLIPASMIFGAGLLLIADIISRIIVSPAELPIGLIMSLLGGPFFLGLLLRHKHQGKF